MGESSLDEPTRRWRTYGHSARSILCCGVPIALPSVVMVCNFRMFAGLILAVQLLGVSVSTASQRAETHAHRRIVKHRPSRTKKFARAGGWAGAGLAAGRAAGPAGSAAVGVVKHRKDLKAGGKRRNKAMVKIGAPIAAGAVAGPAGSAGVEAVEHRKWIKRHILHLKPHNASGS